MKAKEVKKQVRLSQVKKSNEPIVINTSASNNRRSVKRGGCCGKKRT